MRKTFLALVVFFVVLGSKVFGQSPGSGISLDPGNAQYFEFETLEERISKCQKCPSPLNLNELTLTDDESGRKIKPTLAWLKKREDRWVSAFKAAAAILPRLFFKEIGKTTWTFHVDQESWYTATPGTVNLAPSTDKPSWITWITWELLAVNGYSREEMLFVVFHELGHIHDEKFYSSRGLCYYQKQGIYLWANGRLDLVFSPQTTNCWEDSTTFYGRTSGTGEDFAESFALYVMWPEYLKNNFPMHYEVMKTVLGREYKSTYSMPNSIKTRLTVGGSNAANR